MAPQYMVAPTGTSRTDTMAHCQGDRPPQKRKFRGTCDVIEIPTVPYGTPRQHLWCLPEGTAITCHFLLK